MVSIKDIAKLTGFSVTTVSRALNNHDDVSKQTKELIHKVANENNYAPNILAKSLVNKHSKTFGFITSNFSATTVMDSFAFRVFMNCVNRANELGYEVVLIHYKASIHNMKSFNQLISERNLEGAIIQGFDENDPFCQEATVSSIPTVFIDVEKNNDSTTYVSSDIKKAVEIGFSYLLSLGHDSFCFIHGTQESWITNKWLLEVEHFRKENASKIENFVLLNGEYASETTRKKIKEMYSKKENQQFTAIFATSDVMAIGAMKGIVDCGLTVPKDISILGYDNIVLAEYITPTLTTISQNLAGVASKSVDFLFELTKGKKVKPDILDVELVKRESVGVKND